MSIRLIVNSGDLNQNSLSSFALFGQTAYIYLLFWDCCWGKEGSFMHRNGQMKLNLQTFLEELVAFFLMNTRSRWRGILSVTARNKLMEGGVNQKSWNRVKARQKWLTRFEEKHQNYQQCQMWSGWDGESIEYLNEPFLSSSCSKRHCYQIANGPETLKYNTD